MAKRWAKLKPKTVRRLTSGVNHCQMGRLRTFAINQGMIYLTVHRLWLPLEQALPSGHTPRQFVADETADHYFALSFGRFFGGSIKS